MRLAVFNLRAGFRYFFFGKGKAGGIAAVGNFTELGEPFRITVIIFRILFESIKMYLESDLFLAIFLIMTILNPK